MRQPGEPSVEEILDSIKKVIAHDSRAANVGPRPLRTNPQAESPPAAPQDDVLDLAFSAQFLDAQDEEDAANATEPALLNEGSCASMRSSLAALAMMAQPSASPQIVRAGETSLEELTRELLKPALAEWLEKHLPPMVERLVAAEIARIVGKKS
jgi:cell pole-organizing protein PopZ